MAEHGSAVYWIRLELDLPDRDNNNMQPAAPSHSDFAAIVARESGLQKTLSATKLSMIAIGGAIGTGLFLGSGFAIGTAGPAVLLSYAIGAVIAFLLMGCLAEMTVAHPTTGSFGAYAEYYISPLAGFMVRYAYWTCIVLAVGTEVTAVALYMKYWFPSVPGAVWILAFSAALITVNAFRVGTFGAVEYVFSLIKITAIVAFILLAAYLWADDTSGAIGVRNYVAYGGFLPHGAGGMWIAVIMAVFSYLSIEMIAVAAGEAAQPEIAVVRAFHMTVLRLVLFYVLTLALMLAVLPWTRAGSAQSPFVMVMEKLHLPAAGGIMNFVILIAALVGDEQSALHHHAHDVQPVARRACAATPRRPQPSRRSSQRPVGVDLRHCAGYRSECICAGGSVPDDGERVGVRRHVHLDDDLPGAFLFPSGRRTRRRRTDAIPHVGLSIYHVARSGAHGGPAHYHCLYRAISHDARFRAALSGIPGRHLLRALSPRAGRRQRITICSARLRAALMSVPVSRSECEALDARDPLSAARQRFRLQPGCLYLDGHSLGPLTLESASRVHSMLEHEWGRDLIRSWNLHGWFDLPHRLGARIAPLIGAAAEEVLVADSTSVNLFKLASATMMARGKRRRIVTEAGNFPTDLYVLQGLARMLAGAIEIAAVPREDIPSSIDESTFLVVLTHVHYKSAELFDLQSITEQAHAHGAQILWDLSHSVGALPVDLGAARADFAIGCTYKYLNGGPGSPAFLYVRQDLQAQVLPGLAAWMGHATPFDFTDEYDPAPGMARHRSGTPSLLAFAALEGALEIWDGIDLRDIRIKSQQLSELFIQRVGALGATGLVLGSPREMSRRGSHLAFTHARAYELIQALIARGVIGDFRVPDVMRFAFTPLYLRYVDVWDAADILGEVLATLDQAVPIRRNTVT